MRLRDAFELILVYAIVASLIFPAMVPIITPATFLGKSYDLQLGVKQTPLINRNDEVQATTLDYRAPMGAPSPITNYSISALLIDSSHVVTGISTITYVNHAEDILTELYFHLYPNAFRPNGWIDVTDVIHDSNSLNYIIMGSNLTIMKVDLVGGAGPGALSPGANVTLSIVWEITVPNQFDRFGWTNRTEPYNFVAYNMGNWHPVVAVYDERGWDTNTYSYMGESFYSDVAIYDVSITVPDDFIIAATGQLLTITSGISTRTWNFTTGPVNDFTWCASPHYESESVVTNGVNVTSYHAPQHAEGGLRVLEVAEECLEIFGRLFGLYPWNNLAIVEVDFWSGGMEYPQLVMIGRSLYDNPSGLSYLASVTAHEIGHEWIPFILGTDSFTEPWLDEGFASYCEYVWVEHVYGLTARADYRLGDLERYWEYVSVEGDKIVNQSMAYWQTTDWFSYGRIVYAKSALVYDLLRHQIGNETFYQAWQYIYSQAKHQNIRTRTLQQFFENIVGESLDWFFDSWVYGSGVVTLSLGAASTQPSGTGWTTTFQIHQLQSSLVTLYIPISIETVSGDFIELWSNQPLEASTLTVEVETADMPLRLFLDPSRLLLCQYETDTILLTISPTFPILFLIVSGVGIVVVASIILIIFWRRRSQAV